jgi:hypothetical protein
MIQKIKTWFSNYREKQRRKKILEIIKKAKRAYLDHKSPYMCICFYKSEDSFCCYEDIVCKIPEFKPSTFGLYINDTKGCWWSVCDRQSRIDAFDKLIKIYSK